MDYLDFEVQIGQGIGLTHPVEVVHSPAGEARAEMRFPYDQILLENRLQKLELALLSSGSTWRRAAPEGESDVAEFGAALFNALFSGDVRQRFEMSRFRARESGKGLRIKLRFESAELAALPWEFLYDARHADFVCLSNETPIVRYMELAQPIEALTITPPLRILAMVSSPSDLVGLTTEREQARVNAATASLVDKGLVDLVWLEAATWRHLQRALHTEQWHIFHFVGHGGFDRRIGEGLVMLTDEEGCSHRLPASHLARLLGDHSALRLAVVNSCEGARGDKLDIFSSTAATLVRRGTPAVVAMQYQISDGAAIELARSFYEGLTDGLPVDCALAEARKAMSFALPNTLEWGTPVLHMRSPDGVLFKMRQQERRSMAPPGPPPPEPSEAPSTIPPQSSRPSSPLRSASIYSQPAHPMPFSEHPMPLSERVQRATESSKEFVNRLLQAARQSSPPPAPPAPPPSPAPSVVPAVSPFCRRCGTRRLSTGRFCRSCGNSLE